jgi:NADH dehydrogenase FAD-containing subunit
MQSKSQANVSTTTKEPRAQVPTTGLFQANQSGAVMCGVAVSVDATEKSVTLEDGTVLRWDVLVVATGSRSFRFVMYVFMRLKCGKYIRDNQSTFWPTPPKNF